MDPQIPPFLSLRIRGGKITLACASTILVDPAVWNEALVNPPPPPPGRGLTNHWFQFAGRKMGTKWVQFDPILMIVGQDCVVFYEESESGLQMAPKG